MECHKVLLPLLNLFFKQRWCSRKACADVDSSYTGNFELYCNLAWLLKLEKGRQIIVEISVNHRYMREAAPVVCFFWGECHPDILLFFFSFGGGRCGVRFGRKLGSDHAVFRCSVLLKNVLFCFFVVVAAPPKQLECSFLPFLIYQRNMA